MAPPQRYVFDPINGIEPRARQSDNGIWTSFSDYAALERGHIKSARFIIRLTPYAGMITAASDPRICTVCDTESLQTELPKHTEAYQRGKAERFLAERRKGK